MSCNAKPFLEVDDLHFAYSNNIPVLNGVTFNVERGELAVLLGPNGAGKSTLLNCIMNLLTPQQGTIFLEGAPVYQMNRKELAQIIAYVPQNSDINFSYSVRDYVVMGRTPFLRMGTSPKAADYALVDEALDELGIVNLGERSYSALSGGQQQLVNVARAMVQQPQLVLFDEPTSALDYGNQIKVLKMINKLSRKNNFAAIMTTHNPDHPILLDSSVCLLGRDGVLLKGSVDEIMQENVLEDVYQAHMMIRYVEDAHRRVCITPAFDEDE